MSKTVQFSLDDEDHEFFATYAGFKGMSLSALAKASLFAYERQRREKGLTPPKVQKAGDTPHFSGSSGTP